MTTELMQAWILVGYEVFAQEGPKSLKVEALARRVGKSKSSFYHHFADLEVFTELLLQYHLERAAIIVEQEKQCKQVVPDLLNVLVAAKQDLLFNRQLRFNRDVPAFKKCFEQSSKDVAEAILGIWAEMLGLQDHSHLAQIVLNLSLENFYLQITEETLTYDWLENYVNELKRMVMAFQQVDHKQKPAVQ